MITGWCIVRPTGRSASATADRLCCRHGVGYGWNDQHSCDVPGDMDRSETSVGGAMAQPVGTVVCYICLWRCGAPVCSCLSTHSGWPVCYSCNRLDASTARILMLHRYVLMAVVQPAVSECMVIHVHMPWQIVPVLCKPPALWPYGGCMQTDSVGLCVCCWWSHASGWLSASPTACLVVCSRAGDVCNRSAASHQHALVFMLLTDVDVDIVKSHHVLRQVETRSQLDLAGHGMSDLIISRAGMCLP